jgi:hypothetical protein
VRFWVYVEVYLMSICLSSKNTWPFLHSGEGHESREPGEESENTSGHTDIIGSIRHSSGNIKTPL